VTISGLVGALVEFLPVRVVERWIYVDYFPQDTRVCIPSYYPTMSAAVCFLGMRVSLDWTWLETAMGRIGQHLVMMVLVYCP